MSDEDKELEVDVKAGKVRARGYDLITIFVAVVGGAGIYMLYNHVQASEIMNRDLAAAVRSFTVAQREMICMLALPEKDRLNQLGSPNGLCKALAREVP